MFSPAEQVPEAIEAWVMALRAPPATVKLGRNNFRARVLGVGWLMAAERVHCRVQEFEFASAQE